MEGPTPKLVMGAVAYDAKVVTIWEGFKDWFARHGLAFDYVLYSNYDTQVEALVAGQLDVAWNSPLAWLRAQRMSEAKGHGVEAVAMRDTDCDLSSVVVVRADSAITTVHDLRGARVGVGAVDSPQATLIPLSHLRSLGLLPGRDFEVVGHEVGVGKHGDHVGGERDAAAALVAGSVDAACMIDGNHLLFSHDGTLPPASTRIIARTSPYDHCNFTVGPFASPASVARFSELLLAMSYDDPEIRPLLDLEGLKAWRPGRRTGYDALDRAVREQRVYDDDGGLPARP